MVLFKLKLKNKKLVLDMPPNNQTPPPIPPPYQPGQMGGTPPPPAQPAPAQQQPPQPQPAQQAPVTAQPQDNTPPRQQIVERLRQANNVLVTVSNNPSVDQLAACIGLTLVLNKLGKHATAVFSGAVPSTIEFLQPEKTIEKNTDSLRDFIIALDKGKADKLRYKVEDKFVKIFITPYKTSLSEKDLEFSQGDFNVEVVIALGVHQREELDQAITAHGRILHDATVISINNQNTSQLGVINWAETSASSLSELLVGLSETLQPGIIDAQMATAYLTGIVAETKRFSNPKTSAVTMGIASQLMRAGANQQLIATKLDEPAPVELKQPVAQPDLGKKEDERGPAQPPAAPTPPPEPPKKDDGALEIPHEDHPVSAPASTPPPPAGDESDEVVSKIHIDDQGELHNGDAAKQEGSRIMLNPPSMGGTLTSNTQPEEEEASVDPLSQSANNAPLLSRAPSTPATMPASDFGSNTPGSSLDSARQGVEGAAQKQQQALQPIAALNAQPMDLGQNKKEENVNSAISGSATTSASNTEAAVVSTAPPVPPPIMPPPAG